MLECANLINGRLMPAQSGRRLESVEPATGQVWARVPDSNATDVDAAVQAARSAFPAWAATPATERSRLLLRLADLIDRDLDKLAQAEARDTGKPITLARTVDIPRSAANLRFFATAILHSASESHDFDGGGTPGGVPAINYTLRRPRGVAGCISPWNLPLYLFTWKIAPALATGNTVVGKPSEITPVTAAMLGELSIEAGLPPGVLNIVHGTGPGAGAAIVEHPSVPTITFTGSTAVGRWIGETCGRMIKRVSLELGGKNPFIIFDDAELDGPGGAIATAARAAFSNQGQICLCGSRLLVHERVFDRVLAGVVEQAAALRAGDPLDPATRFGALTSKAHLEKVEGFVNLARELGGRVHTGGQRLSVGSKLGSGFFYAPTVITGLDPACRVEQEEVFGPVVTLQRFGDDHEAIALANCTPYGLAATIFTQDVGRAHRVAAAIDAGIIWINCWMVRDLRTSFGGMKHSGVGREGGLDAIRFFTEAKNVCVKT
jgi:aminomuconate-semialdehyde/2-hydroxymuconate-6-semialdehyde dehydrogenase